MDNDLIKDRNMEVLLKTLVNCENVNYKGIYKFDYVNSKNLKILTDRSKYFRVSLKFVGSRSPINFRKILGVENELNYKCIALFANSYYNLYRITNDEKFFDKDKHLIDILMSGLNQDLSGSCWGSNYALENLSQCIPKNEPNMIVTYFAGCALLKYYEISNKEFYLKKCEEIYNFITNDLKKTVYNSSEICYSYSPFDEYKIINSNAMIVSILSRLYAITSKEKYKLEADKLVKFIINRQTDYGAWYYAYPKESSHLKHDNYHTGYVLDSLYDYIKFCNESEIMEYYKRGLDFYRNNLFLETGAPKFKSDQTYPIDIHGSAQGIITFAKSPYPDDINFAKKIADWTVKNMYDDQGFFYYQKRKYYTNKINYIRWNQAWMCYALSYLMLKQKKKTGDSY